MRNFFARKDFTRGPSGDAGKRRFGESPRAILVAAALSLFCLGASAKDYEDFARKLEDECVGAVSDKTDMGVYARQLCGCAMGELAKNWPAKERAKIASIDRKLEEAEEASAADRALMNRFLESLAREATVKKCYRTVMNSGR